MEQEAIERLQVSEQLAEEIRTQIFVYAAENLVPESSESERRDRLLYYGGVR